MRKSSFWTGLIALAILVFLVVIVMYSKSRTASPSGPVESAAMPMAIATGSVPSGTAAGISADEAVKRAVAELGLTRYDQNNVKVNLEVLTSDVLPFLGDALNGKKTWVVEFNDVRLETEKPGIDNKYIRHLKVVLSPDSGQILTVTSAWPDNTTATEPVLPTAEIARQFKRNHDTFVGLPSEAPQATLVQALNGEETMFWGADVKQVVAYYVTETAALFSNRPVWVIQLRGFLPFVKSGPPGTVGASSLDHLTNVIDAKTGEWYSGGSAPEPVSEK